MKFATATFAQVLLATAAFALPSSRERFERRLARRAAGRQTNPRLPAVSDNIVTAVSNVSHVEYSSNWAGAVMSESSATWTQVTGTFVVPTPSAPSGSRTAYASAWVGIDGDTCGNAILQTGLDFNVENGAVSYDAWYEWYPDYAYDFSGISFKAGDTVTVTVKASSKTGGSATIKNVSSGKSVSHTFSGQPALCEFDAEWIVEDFESGGSLVPFADFGSVTFSNAVATRSGGGTTGPSGATIIDLQQNNKVLTSCSASSSSVTCSYT